MTLFDLGQRSDAGTRRYMRKHMKPRDVELLARGREDIRLALSDDCGHPWRDHPGCPSCQQARLQRKLQLRLSDAAYQVYAWGTWDPERSQQMDHQMSAMTDAALKEYILQSMTKEVIDRYAAGDGFPVYQRRCLHYPPPT